MGILRANTISGLGTDGAVFQGVTKFDTQGYVVPSSGTTDQRSAGITTTQGAIRFNTDSQKLEFYAQGEWWNMVTDTPNLGTSSDTTAGARGLIGGGYVAPASQNTIDYINISSTGNAQDFGDLITAQSFNGSCSSSTRGLFAGSFPSSNTIEYVTISSTGNAQDFGDLTVDVESVSGTSNSTRGLFFGGIIYAPAAQSTNVISYVTISTTGNANDFGDLQGTYRNVGGVSSSTRGIFAGGFVLGGSYTNIIQYVTIATTGNAQDFGDLSIAKYEVAGCSNSTRGLFGGGYIVPSSFLNIIEYVTLSTLGNSIKFGDLTQSRRLSSACSSSTRGVWGGGVVPGVNLNTIDYVTILTQGNAVDFGDLTLARQGLSACSNAHGGL
jgi:hypothetical protein